MKAVIQFGVAGLFLLGLPWALPHGCAQTQQASEAIDILGQCDAVAELVGEDLRPTLGYALGSYEQNAGETRVAATLTVRGDKARGKVSYRYHSRHGLEARLESQGEEITLAACVEGEDAEEHRLDGISDRSRVDLEKVQSSALELARERWPDAGIARILAENVYPDGHADLTLGEGHLTINLGAAAEQDPALPKGVAGGQSPECLLVVVGRDQTVVTETKGTLCQDYEKGNVAMGPKCDVRQIWGRAVEAGAPSENAVATLSYIALDKNWMFSIDEFVRRFPDDCT